jgi:hypothetical protein
MPVVDQHLWLSLADSRSRWLAKVAASLSPVAEQLSSACLVVSRPDRRDLLQRARWPSCPMQTAPVCILVPYPGPGSWAGAAAPFQCPSQSDCSATGQAEVSSNDPGQQRSRYLSPGWPASCTDARCAQAGTHCQLTRLLVPLPGLYTGRWPR